MAGRLTLEAFDGVVEPVAPAAPEEQDAELEEMRLAAYERGYSAGWEDAVAAQSSDQQRIREDLARNLRDLSFTYQEARAHMLTSLEPLLRALVDRVLPDIAGAMLGPFVVAEIAAEAERMADTPMIVAVSPENRAAVEAALPDAAGLPVELTEDATLADGQVRFAFGSGERTLDLDALLSTIQRLMTDFLSTEDERKVSNG